MLELDKQRLTIPVFENLDSEEVEQRQFKMCKTQESFTLLDNALDKDMDPYALRFARMMTAAHDARTSCRFILEEKKKEVV